MLWLCNWRADAKFKWRLASAPIQGALFFGEALEPVLIENEGPAIILQTGRSACYSILPQIILLATQIGLLTTPTILPSVVRMTDRAEFHNEPRQHLQAKQPFQGAGGHAFRRP